MCPCLGCTKRTRFGWFGVGFGSGRRTPWWRWSDSKVNRHDAGKALRVKDASLQPRWTKLYVCTVGRYGAFSCSLHHTSKVWRRLRRVWSYPRVLLTRSLYFYIFVLKSELIAGVLCVSLWQSVDSCYIRRRLRPAKTAIVQWFSHSESFGSRYRISACSVTHSVAVMAKKATWSTMSLKSTAT